MREHRLKIKDEYLISLIASQKKAEVRFNDRDYKVGDLLVFQRPYFMKDNRGIKYRFEITHVHEGLGLADGYVMLSLKQLPLSEGVLK